MPDANSRTGAEEEERGRSSGGGAGERGAVAAEGFARGQLRQFELQCISDIMTLVEDRYKVIAKQVGCILVVALDKIVVGYNNLFDKFDVLVQCCHYIQYTLNVLSYIITNLSVRDDLED